MDDALGYSVARVTEAGRNARRARRQYSEDWDSQDLIRNIVRTSDSSINRDAGMGEELFDGVDLVLALNSPKMSPKVLRTIKAKLLTMENGEDVLNSMRQAPLLEALHASIEKVSQKTAEDGLVILDEKKFKRVINKIQRRIREELWGKDFTKNLDKTIRSWADRWNSPSFAGSSNPSGTFVSLVRSMRFLPTGRLRNIGMAGSGAAEGIFGALQRPARERLAAQVTDPSVTDMPVEVYDEQISEILTQFEEQFRGANGTRYGDLLRTLGRTGVVWSITRDE